MPALTIGRMAKMYRLHRSTLYEAVEKGRFTAGFDGKGQRVIDLSEMIRVYGEPPGQPGKPDTNPTPSPDTPPDIAQAMLEELRAMRAELVALREEVAQLRALPAPGQGASHPDDERVGRGEGNEPGGHDEAAAP
ncbi:hypothetical protein [Halomonas aquatica]|uniref:Helix-turn-helix domain-containing protein n=1 Tax=Halomonas aquatica TaxID=3151123 RepID=A0ABV1NI96_9GAMM